MRHNSESLLAHIRRWTHLWSAQLSEPHLNPSKGLPVTCHVRICRVMNP